MTTRRRNKRRIISINRGDHIPLIDALLEGLHNPQLEHAILEIIRYLYVRLDQAQERLPQVQHSDEENE